MICIYEFRYLITSVTGQSDDGSVHGAKKLDPIRLVSM
jgi:hypothetical protein